MAPPGRGRPTWLLIASAWSACPSRATSSCSARSSCAAATRIDLRASYQITMAGLAATRLFAAAGAGGIALTAWALRRSGMARRDVAGRMLAFLVLLYTVYVGALVIGGLGLLLGHLQRRRRRSRSPWCPPIFGAVRVPGGRGDGLPARRRRALDRQRGPRRGPRPARCWRAPRRCPPRCRPASARRSASCARGAGACSAPSRWWGFDIAVLWACFHAFGADPPPIAVIVMAYFVGMLANTLPLPGGIGGVDGGMIGAFAAFDVRLRLRDRRGAHLPCLRLLAADPAGRDRVLPAAAHGRRLARGARRAAEAERLAGVATIQSEVTPESEVNHVRRRERDHRRQRPGRLHRGALHGTREPEPAGHRGLPLGRPAPADDRGRELPRLPRRRSWAPS